MKYWGDQLWVLRLTRIGFCCSFCLVTESASLLGTNCPLVHSSPLSFTPWTSPLTPDTLVADRQCSPDLHWNRKAGLTWAESSTRNWASAVLLQKRIILLGYLWQLLPGQNIGHQHCPSVGSACQSLWNVYSCLSVLHPSTYCSIEEALNISLH